MENERKATHRSKGFRTKIIAGALAGAGLFGLAVPAAVIAQTDDGANTQQTQEAPEEGPRGERPKGLEGLVEEGVLTQEQADALRDAVEPIKENEELSREEKREQIEAAVNQLVDDGVLTQEQVDQIRENRPRHGHHGPRGRGPEAAAEAIGVSVEDLRSEIESGKTIADVADENGVDPQTVIDALVADMSEHIDQAVEDGRLTAEEAEEKKAEASERAATIVNNTQEAKAEHESRGPGGPGGPNGPEGPNAPEGEEQGTATEAFQSA